MNKHETKQTINKSYKLNKWRIERSLKHMKLIHACDRDWITSGSLRILRHSSTGRRWWDRSASGSSSRSPSDSPSVSFVETPLRALGGAESLWQRSSPPLLLVREQLGVATWDLIDREDSVSACSKNTYLAANNRARESVMTCSRSTLREKEIITDD